MCLQMWGHHSWDSFMIDLRSKIKVENVALIASLHSTNALYNHSFHLIGQKIQPIILSPFKDIGILFLNFQAVEIKSLRDTLNIYQPE